MDEFSDLQIFDSAFNPHGTRAKSASDLPDGEYEFEVVSCSLGKTTTTKETIFKQLLRVSSDGELYERAILFKNSISVDILGAELLTLGYDVDLWVAPQRPFSREFPPIVPTMVGIRFRARKETVAGKDGKNYCNLKNVTPLPRVKPARSAQPAAPVEAPRATPTYVDPASRRRGAQVAPAVAVDDDIPF